jgi:putative glutamine amidotransferase
MSKSKSKNQNRKTTSVRTVTPAPKVRQMGDAGTRPRILVLEALSGSTSAVRDAGGYPLTASPTDAAAVRDALAGKLGRIDGLLLTGGGDVNPRLYRRRPHRKVYGVNEVRDAVEITALDYARKNELPVLGICRGNQIQNVFAGGTLRQHIGGHYGEHDVLVTPGSVFADAVVDRLDVYVQSLHHQEIGRVADSYRITGRAPDGTVEAIESKDGRCLGVQFHPEMHTEYAYARDIFRWLVESSAKHAGLPTPPDAVTPYQYSWSTPKPNVVDTAFNIKPVVAYSWCSFCSMRIDRRDDYRDHMFALHSVYVADDDASGIKSETAPYRETSQAWDDYEQALSDYEEWA